MEPTFRDGSWTLVNTLLFSWRVPRRGDVVGIRLAGRGVMYLKRIVGLPGERVAFERGTVVVDGRPLEEGYVQMRGDWTEAPVLVGEDEYFVVGDNRAAPARRHVHGRVHRGRLVGGAVF